MKKVIASVLSVAMVAAIAAGCTTQPTDAPVSTTAGGTGETEAPVETEEPVETEPSETEPVSYGTGAEHVNLWSFTDEIPNMVKYYISQNPEFGEKYTFDCTIIATDGSS